MIEAYLDESGIHDGAAVCIIAGYYGDRNQLRKLEARWKATLNDRDFPMAEFHAKDLIKQRKHQPMLGALARAIASVRKVHPVVWGIVVGDFFSFTEDQRKFLTGATLDPRSGKLFTTGCPSKPYFVPFQQVVRLVCDHAPVGGRAHFAFGIDRPFAEYARALFRQMEVQATMQDSKPWLQWRSMDRLGNALFPRANETAQLQAADLLAHLAYLFMKEWLDGGKKHLEPTQMIMDCLRNAVQDPVYQDRESLDKMLRSSRRIAGDWDSRSR